jgi:hypothetical protein
MLPNLILAFSVSTELSFLKLLTFLLKPSAKMANESLKAAQIYILGHEEVMNQHFASCRNPRIVLSQKLKVPDIA